VAWDNVRFTPKADIEWRSSKSAKCQKQTLDSCSSIGRLEPDFGPGGMLGLLLLGAPREKGLGISLHGSNLKTLMSALGQKQT
jgi:hypothetical protein